MSHTLTTSIRNFGVLTDISKGINYSLGDRSDRTVSMRTAHGLKRALNQPEMHDDTAEDIAHFGMIGAALILFTGAGRRNNFLLAIAVLLIVGLIICYHLGRTVNPK